MNLQNYPGLLAWHRQQLAVPPSAEDTVLHFTWRLCEALSAPSPGHFDLINRAFDYFNEASCNHHDDLLRVIRMFQSSDADFLELMSELGEHAVKFGRIKTLYQRISLLAQTTKLASIQFLAAWSALNADDLRGCIDECERVSEPFASVHTIHGQALLEVGQVSDAIEILVIATKLSPNELLAWFQLAKAYHINSAYDAAWLALKQCQRLAPQSEEIALFLALTALQTNDHKADERLGQAFQALKHFLTQMPSNSIAVATLAQLACRLEDKEKLLAVINQANWSELKNCLDFARRLPPVLRSLHELGWMDLASHLLQSMTVEKLA